MGTARSIAVILLMLACGPAIADETAPVADTATRAVNAAVSRLGTGDPEVRKAALRELEHLIAGYPSLGPRCLVRLKMSLRRGDPDERIAVMKVLAHIPGDEARVTWLERLDDAVEAREDVWAATIDAARVRQSDRASERALVKLVRAERMEPTRRALLYEALGHFKGPAVLLALSRPAKGKAETWVEAAGRACGLGNRKDEASIPVLLDLLEHPQRAVVMAAWESLVRRTGRPLGPKAALWRAWWAGRKKPKKAEPAKAEKKDDRYAPTKHVHVPTYYGVPIPRPGSRVVFCIDTSQSMYGDGIRDARRHLSATIHELPATHVFEIVAFNERIYPYAKRLVKAHPVMKWRAIEWLNARETISLTNIYDAVETAFQHMGLGRKPSAEPLRLDMIFLLSDGAPNRGRYHNEDRVVKHIAKMSNREVPVHSIAAGERVHDLLQRIARATGGVFVDAFE